MDVIMSGTLFFAVKVAFEEARRLDKKTPELTGLSDYEVKVRTLPNHYRIELQIKQPTSRSGSRTLIIDRKDFKVVRVYVA
jgi:hypothetical protein